MSLSLCQHKMTNISLLYQLHEEIVEKQNKYQKWKVAEWIKKDTECSIPFYQDKLFMDYLLLLGTFRYLCHPKPKVVA